MTSHLDTVQVAETPRPHATDKVAALCLALLAICGRSTVLGRTFDLKSTYRQLAVAPESSWLAMLLVGTRPFRRHGSSACVHSLLAQAVRCTRSFAWPCPSGSLGLIS